MGLRINLRLNALASSLLRSPPGVCLWSPHHTTRPLRGTLAMAAASSRFPYCWPSSLRQRRPLTSTELLGCMAAYIPVGSHLRNQWSPAWCVRQCCGIQAEHLASFGWQGLFPAQWHPPTFQIFLPARVEAVGIQYAWRRHAPLRSLWLRPWPSRLGPSPISQQSWQLLLGFSQWDSPFVLLRWTEPKQ